MKQKNGTNTPPPIEDEELSNMPLEVYKELLHEYRLIEEEFETRKRTRTLTAGGHIRLKRKLLGLQKLVNTYKSDNP